jgi:hypothetical protein
MRKHSKEPTRRVLRMTVRLTREDRKTLAAVRAALPQPCTDATAIRFALRTTEFWQQQHAAGNKVSVTSPDGTKEIVLINI